jgi:hypothetical protein
MSVTVPHHDVVDAERAHRLEKLERLRERLGATPLGGS